MSFLYPSINPAQIADVAYAPDGALIALALESGTLALIEPEYGKTVRELRPQADDLLEPSAPLTSVAFAPGGQALVTGDQNGNVVVWSVAEGQMLAHENTGMRVVADVAYSPDGALIAAASEGWKTEPGSVWLFNAVSGESGRLTIDDEERWLGSVKRVGFAADGSSLVAATADGAVVRWSLPDGVILTETVAHRAMITALALAPEGDLFTAGYDGALRRWDAAGGLRMAFDGMPSLTSVVIDQQIVASGGADGSLTFWTVNGEQRSRVQAHTGPITALALSPDGRFLASAGADGLIRLWTWPAGAPGGEWSDHEGPVLGMAFAPDGRTLASSGWDGTVRLWGWPDGAPLATLTVIETDGLGATNVPDVTFTDQGRSVAAASYAGTIQRYALPEGTPGAALESDGANWLIDLVSLPDNRLLAVDDAGTVWIWHADGRLAARQDAMAEHRGALAVLDANRLIASWKGLNLWRLDGDGLTFIETEGSAGGYVAATADGRLVVVGSPRGSIEVWRVE
ncbi:MAG: WD40 repeat domain-containing protein [Chloroflexaceae bacterium]